ncbi:MAG: DUF2130 domain-containing protein [Chitinophagales bacterium]
MSTIVVCPNCKTEFEPTAAIAQSVRDEMAKEYNQKWIDSSRQKDEQFRQKELQWQQQQQELAMKMEEEKKALSAQLKKELEKQVGADYEHKLRLLEDTNKTNQAKLSEAREKEMELLKKEQEMITKMQEADLAMQRKIAEERNKLSEIVKKEEEEKSRLRETEYQMKVMEMQKQLDDQKKLVEEMRRKGEQGSMQLQGEVQELALEELLRYAFPFDVVQEVGKGVKGADCIQTVRNSFGQECGKIIFESKRTKDFSEDWIEKLKGDMRILRADVAVIVTQAMPKDMNHFGEKDGIWICSFSEARALVHVLRDLIIKVYTASKSQENKGDKMTLLYNYFISTEFSEQWRAIREGFMGMKMSIQRERDQMEKMWKAREKQLDKVLLNAAHFKGAIEGIAGMDVDLNLLGEENGYMIE